MIQAVALAEQDGLKAANAFGHLPLVDSDPTRPALVDNGYWDHVDYIVGQANAKGMLLGFLPTWGRYCKARTVSSPRP